MKERRKTIISRLLADEQGAASIDWTVLVACLAAIALGTGVLVWPEITKTTSATGGKIAKAITAATGSGISPPGSVGVPVPTPPKPPKDPKSPFGGA